MTTAAIGRGAESEGPSRQTGAVVEEHRDNGHAVVGKPRYFDIIDTAEALGWRVGLSNSEWAVLNVLLQRASRAGWDKPLAIAAKSIADRTGFTPGHIRRLRASLEKKGAVTVYRGHADMPGRPARAARYVVRYDNLKASYDDLNPWAGYDEAKAVAESCARSLERGKARGLERSRAHGLERVRTYDTHPPSSLVDVCERSDASTSTEKKKIEDVEENAIRKAARPPTASETPKSMVDPLAQRDEAGAVPHLVRHISELDGVVLPRSELARPPEAFTRAMRDCIDAGMKPAAIEQAAEHAVARRSGNAVKTLRYFPVWFENAAAEATAEEQQRDSERAHQRRVHAEVIERRQQRPELHALLVAEENERLGGVGEPKAGRAILGDAQSDTPQGVAEDADSEDEDLVRELEAVGADPTAIRARRRKPRPAIHG